MKKNVKVKYLLPAVLCLLFLAGLGYYYLFTSFSASTETSYVYIDEDDNLDSLMVKVEPVAQKHSYHAFCALTRHSSLVKRLHPGRYAVAPSISTFTVFRHIKNGMQTPVSLTVPSVRTVEDLASRLSSKLMLDSAALADALKDAAVCSRFGYDTTTIAAMFIPNTYDVYWNVSVEGLLKYMQKESRKFWDEERTAKANRLKLSPVEVITLASIVDEETANDGEKPMVAGMYYNRLMLRNAEYPDGMPLQADPTIKFAWKQFALKRIYNKLLGINSPYNTYRYAGLPPGPIRIPSVAGIDAVLNLKRHDYIYMCAKEDFSGTHNFARTYEEHLANARRYTEALNQRGIK